MPVSFSSSINTASYRLPDGLHFREYDYLIDTLLGTSVI